MESSNDKALIDFGIKFKAVHPGGVFPWSAILAALAAILGGCTQPTPATLKHQVQRPIVLIRIRRRLVAEGVPLSCVDECVEATAKAVAGSSDQELKDLVAAAQETE